MIIAVDFDGTCVSHEYPEVGKDIGAIPVLKEIIKSGHNIILLTMRAKDNHLDDALNWFKNNDIPLYGANENPDQHKWSNSRKVYAHLYIDDANLGCPLIFPKTGRAYVDWEKVTEELRKMKIILGE